MGGIGFLFAVIMCGLIVALSYWWNKRKEEKVNQEYISMNQDAAVRKVYDNALERSEQTMEEKKGTRDLFMETLTKLGCQYEIDEEDDQIRFMWQGGHFAADAQNDCAFVIVWYLYWDEYELYDVDSLSMAKRVMNDANISYNINVVYSVNEAGSTFHVHSKKHFLFIQQIPDIEGYLQTILGMFFQVQHYFNSEMVKLKNEDDKMARHD